MISLYILAGSILLAVLGYGIRKLRAFLAALAMIGTGLSAGLALSMYPSVWTLLLVAISLYQIMNIARLIDGRLHAKYLKAAFFKGGGRLLGMQLILFGLSWLQLRFDSLSGATGTIFVYAQTIVAVGVCITIGINLYRSRPRDVRRFLSDRELPSISVLIPARNEDRNLEELLHTIVANDYPKLEVLVLDDCSTGKNISEIVRGFAHQGVRFVQGDIPSENWLAKNQAYATLANQASGDWLVFMGVDVRLGVGSLRSLIHYAINHDKTMLSVLPRRFDGAFWAGFFSPLRYFRELTRISWKGHNIPALSTVWVIQRKAYDSLGGIESVARKVIPEHYFARQLAKIKQYGFIRTNDYLQVSTAKVLREQIATSIRVDYPGHHRRMEWSALTSLGMVMFFLLPFVQLLSNILSKNYGTVFWLSLLSVCLLTLGHLLITTFTNPILWPLAVVNFPYLVVQEVVIAVLSMYGYEFGEVYWKGRNVCLPVMHVIPRLPKIDE